MSAHRGTVPQQAWLIHEDMVEVSLGEACASRKALDAAARGLRLASVSSCSRGLLASESGIATTEFVLILPFLILLAFGSVEIANALTHARKVEVLSRTVADLIGRTAAPTRAEIDDIFRSSHVVLMPFENETLEMVVSAVGVFGEGTSGALRVCSSVGFGSSRPRQVSAVPPTAVPPEFEVNGTRLLFVEIRMKYRAITGNLPVGALGKFMNDLTL